MLVFPAAALRGSSATPEVFAENLDRPYGIAFHPPENPRPGTRRRASRNGYFGSAEVKGRRSRLRSSRPILSAYSNLPLFASTTTAARV